MDIDQWLDQLGLAQYQSVFRENDIEFDVLGDLTEQDFRELGVSLGHRKKIIRAIESLDKTPEAVTQQVIADALDADPERRYLSLMFCDLADSTKMSAHIDMEEMHEINRAFQETCTLVINKIDGFVARYMGDGILAYFGYPTAHENDAERAVIAGIEITQAIKKLSNRYQLPDGMQLNVRIGIATGPVVVEIIGSGASQESAVVGEAPNLAARLQGLAMPNSVVIEPSTRRLLHDRYQLESLGAHPMKGFTEKVEVWQVLGEQVTPTGSDVPLRQYASPLIGREEEMNLLNSRWQRVKSGEGQVVLLSGEAGIGKSRVTQALIDQVKTEAYARVRFFCSPYHTQTALHPFLSHIQKEAGLLDDSSNQEKQKRLERVLLDIYGFSREILPIIANLISLELDDQYPSEQRDAISQLNLLQAALVQFLISRSNKGPVLLIIEDTHWIDPTSKSLLDTLVNDSRNKRLYILANSRPESNFAYNNSHVTKLSLNKLSEKDVDRMIQGISLDSGLSDTVVNSINQKSDGIPLFVEEVTKMIIESQRAKDKSQSNNENNTIRVPDSLQASLLSRLDQLGKVKSIAQAAAVVGDTFGETVLSHVCQQPVDKIRPNLELLVEHDVIHKQSSIGEPVYRFRHALLRDAAYESLMRKNRRSLHGSVATYLNEIETSTLATNHEMIAYHFNKADDESNAYFHWINAGLNALEAGATVEAVGLLNNARSCEIKGSPYANDHELMFQLEMAHGQALNASFGAASELAHSAFKQAVIISQQYGSIEQQIDALDYEFGITFNAGNIEESLIPAENMLALGVEHNHLVGRISGYQVLGMAYYALGDFEQARFALESALDTKGETVTGINSYPSMTLDYLSYVLFIIGETEAASEKCKAALISARKESDYSTATALYNSSVTQFMLGRLDLVKDYAIELIDVTETTGQYMYLNRGKVFKSLAAAALEHDTDSLDFVVNAINKLLDSGEEIDLTFFLGVIAELQISFQRYADAHESLTKALELSDKNKEHFYLAELYRLQSLLILSELKEDWQANALNVLDHAMQVAQQQGAHGWIEKIEETRKLLPH